MPSAHFLCALHVSVVVEDEDSLLLKCPDAHFSHTGSADPEPVFFVYVPDGHFVWSLHTSTSASTTSFLVAPSLRHLPVPQIVHCVSVLLSPTLDVC